MMDKSMNEKQSLINWITMMEFCAIDMQLYLDTHPTDQKAIEYFNECVRLLENAKRTLKEKYGVFFTVSEGAPYEEYFTWTNMPMPWEGGSC